jgi:ribonucleotide monophosphatase NagD (HAD superfamily)
LFIGDSLSKDALAAQACGMTGVHLDRGESNCDTGNLAAAAGSAAINGGGAGEPNIVVTSLNTAHFQSRIRHWLRQKNILSPPDKTTGTTLYGE